MASYKIENWWRHNGCYDREQASGIPYNPEDGTGHYFYATDDWWEGLSDSMKERIYNDFFDEN